MRTPLTSATRTASRIAAAALGLLFPGCSGPSAPSPPDIRWGEDVCSLCTMIISEQQHAAAAAVPAGRRWDYRVYDDIGCLLHDRAADSAKARWVRDLDGARWIPADSASFVMSPRLRTPMGSGIAAFTSREGAGRLAGGDGAVILDWDGLRRRSRDTGVIAPPPPADRP